MGMERKISPRRLRWAMALAGEAALAGALLSTARWYSLFGVVVLFAIGSAPLIGYATSLRTFAVSLAAGLVLLILTLWTSISFALVPAQTRDGVEVTWIFFDFLLGVLLAAAGLIVERRLPSRTLRS
jgi:hypothetical protein